MAKNAKQKKYSEDKAKEIIEGVLALKSLCQFVKDIGIDNAVAFIKAIDVIRANDD